MLQDRADTFVEAKVKSFQYRVLYVLYMYMYTWNLPVAYVPPQQTGEEFLH